MNQVILPFFKGWFPWVILFLLLISCLFCMDSYASSTVSSPSQIDLFDSNYKIPDFPVDDSRPFHFIAYYPESDRYLLIQLDREMMFEYSNSVRYGYYMNLDKYDYKLYEWYPSRSDFWVTGSFANGSITSSRWYGWIGFGDCPTSFYGGKRILYSNFSVRNSADKSIMYYRTPFITGLSWQWAFSNFVQQLFTLILPVLKGICLLLLGLFCLVRLIRTLLFFVKGRNSL